MATHSSILAWRISWTVASQAPGYSPWDRKESDMTEQLHIITYINIYILSFKTHENPAN